MEDLTKKLKTKLTGLKINEPLAQFTTFKIGGPAKFFFVGHDNNSIIKAIKYARELGLNYFILGNGSNILISDKGFDGLVIKMENKKTFFDEEEVKAESGLPLQKLIRETIAKKLTGLEFLIGIPGTVGGGVAGNVGTPTNWIGEKITEVEVLNAESEVNVIPKSQCDFSYRFSRFKYDDKEIILAVKFRLEKSSSNIIQKKVTDFLNNRSHQPISKPCAGSIFKNPEGKKAWQLIDEAGLRGKQIGGAKVSDEHANFIINTGFGKAEDVVILISYIKQQVRDQTGYQLQEEIKYVGF